LLIQQQAIVGRKPFDYLNLQQGVIKSYVQERENENSLQEGHAVHRKG
jgi:hypothetical protein